MEITDYNGTGDWTRDAILRRYSRYCSQLGIEEADMSPLEHVEHDRKWVYPVMDKVIAGIERGDAACKMIGIEFLEQDQSFSFGRTLKSNTARALRRAVLTDEDKARIRTRVVHMLLAGNICREYKEYAKLLKKIGLEGFREEIETGADRENPHVMRYVRYLLEHDNGKPSPLADARNP